MNDSNTMLKFNETNSISKDALRDEGYLWLINCTIQEYSVNVGQNSLFNKLNMFVRFKVMLGNFRR